MKTLGFIGGGRVTRILLNGFRNAEVRFKKILVCEPDLTVLNTLKADFPEVESSDISFSSSESPDLLFIALHPPVMIESLKMVKETLDRATLIISLAPKITLDQIRKVLPGFSNIGRMNPNAGTYINMGFNPVCFTEDTDDLLVKELISIFEKLGKVPLVEERTIEAYAVISAMGPTYFWFQLKQLQELGLSWGLSENDINDAITAMITGTASTLFNSGLNYNSVVDLVPVKPLSEHENTIREFYKVSLNGIYQKIKPV